ncbi:MAG: hypothetical protein HY939_00020 [Gammaproteobacteria bacterium]|nr:hypothetical protein [Gammaproteobacteria bacterium]
MKNFRVYSIAEIEKQGQQDSNAPVACAFLPAPIMSVIQGFDQVELPADMSSEAMSVCREFKKLTAGEIEKFEAMLGVIFADEQSSIWTNSNEMASRIQAINARAAKLSLHDRLQFAYDIACKVVEFSETVSKLPGGIIHSGAVTPLNILGMLLGTLYRQSGLSEAEFKTAMGKITRVPEPTAALRALTPSIAFMMHQKWLKERSLLKPVENQPGMYRLCDAQGQPLDQAARERCFEKARYSAEHRAVSVLPPEQKAIMDEALADTKEHCYVSNMVMPVLEGRGDISVRYGSDGASHVWLMEGVLAAGAGIAVVEEMQEGEFAGYVKLRVVGNPSGTVQINLEDMSSAMFGFEPNKDVLAVRDVHDVPKPQETPAVPSSIAAAASSTEDTAVSGDEDLNKSYEDAMEAYFKVAQTPQAEKKLVEQLEALTQRFSGQLLRGNSGVLVLSPSASMPVSPSPAANDERDLSRVSTYSSFTKRHWKALGYPGQPGFFGYSASASAPMSPSQRSASAADTSDVSLDVLGTPTPPRKNGK